MCWVLRYVCVDRYILLFLNSVCVVFGRGGSLLLCVWGRGRGSRVCARGFHCSSLVCERCAQRELMSGSLVLCGMDRPAGDRWDSAAGTEREGVPHVAVRHQAVGQAARGVLERAGVSGRRVLGHAGGKDVPTLSQCVLSHRRFSLLQSLLQMVCLQCSPLPLAYLATTNSSLVPFPRSWPTPILLTPVTDANMGYTVWDPKVCDLPSY